MHFCLKSPKNYVTVLHYNDVLVSPFPGLKSNRRFLLAFRPLKHSVYVNLFHQLFVVQRSIVVLHKLMFIQDNNGNSTAMLDTFTSMDAISICTQALSVNEVG